jgi:hypothetical protein
MSDRARDAATALSAKTSCSGGAGSLTVDSPMGAGGLLSARGAGAPAATAYRTRSRLGPAEETA